MKCKNTYKGGVDRDTSKLKYPQDRYFYAQNFRPITDSGESTWAMENVVGNESLLGFAGSTGANDTLLGSTNIRNTTVLFTTDGTGANPGGIDPSVTASATSAGRIWTVNMNHENPGRTLELKVDTELNFTSQKPIKAIGRYENEDVQKVYWIDHLNNMRFANLSDSDISSYTPGQFDIVADVALSMPTLVDMGGGSLNVGVVQYAYQLFNEHGAQTTYSPTSYFVHLTKASDAPSHANIYGGTSQLDDNGNQNVSGKSVTMQIADVDISFDWIRVVAIHYVSLNATPSINVVTVKSTDTTVQFTDDGVYDQGSVTLEEYRLLSQRLFTARTLESKDNILFAGNVTDRFFDVEYDARAYRFNSDQDCRLYEVDGVTLEYGISGATPSYPTGGATGVDIDAFNLYNDVSIDQTRTATHNYIYQADGSRLGGQGPNVSYTFGVKTEILDSSEAAYATGTFYPIYTDVDDLSLSFSNYGSPYFGGGYQNYHRGEIYRFGIIFYDEKGRVSPVKWIGDIRMPDQSSVDSVTTYASKKNYLVAYWDGPPTGTLKIYFNMLKVNFTVSNIPSEAVAYQIVRVKRKSQDRTVLGQGELLAAKENPNLTGPQVYSIPDLNDPVYTPYYCPDSNSALSLFYSPEISFNKNLVVGGNDFVEAVCGKDLDTTGATGSWSHYDLAPADGNIYKFKGYVPLGTDEYSSKQFDVTDGQIVSPGNTATQYTVDSVVYSNMQEFDTDDTTYGGHVLVVNEPDAGWANSGGASTALMVNYRRPVTQYGGYAYEDRSLNEYIACSSLISGTSYAPAYGGDTFINFFDCQRSLWDLTKDSVNSQSIADYFVVESSINLDLRHDDCMHKVKDTANAYMIQEEAGPHVDDGGDGNAYTQETNLYLYNSVYSQGNSSKIYYPLQPGFDEQTKSDCLIIASNVKTNGELIDSWTQFAEAEEIEVDSRYGPVSKLMNFANHLVYFQDDAIGTVGVNQQTLMKSGEVSSLILGKGDILDRYDYLTMDSGCQIQEAVCKSANGFYWYDSVRNKFSRYSGGLKNISDINGMFSYFNKRVMRSDDGRSDLYTGTQIMSVFDKKFNEAHYTFNDIRVGCVSAKNPSPSYIRVTFKEGDFNSMETGDNVVVDGISATATFASPYMNINNPSYYDDYSVNDDIRVYFPDSDYNFTLVYNELIDAFVYWATYNPDMYVENPRAFYSVAPNTYMGIYEHNAGERGKFYGTCFPSIVQPLINPNEDVVNVFTHEEIMTEVTDSDGDEVVDETISSIRVTNDYQDTGTVSLVPDTNIKRRLRKWRFVVPRETTARIRDAYMKIFFSYTNVDDKRIVFHDVISHYIPREF